MVPPGYVDITTALYSRGSVNVIGVVVDVFGDVFKTGGSSVCITFTLKDINLDNGHSWDGLKIKYFNDDRASLPPIKERDVVLLQGLRVRTFNGKTIAVASQHETVPWAIYRQESDARTTASPISGPKPFEPSNLEKKYALALLKRASSVDATGHLRAVEAYKSSQVVQASVSNPKPGGKQFALIKDIVARTYVILVCEVLSISDNDSEKVIIDVTDYTPNDGLSDGGADDGDGREGDSFNYLTRPKRKRNGPLGRMTLRITLWDPHAAFARVNIRPNHFVYLNNVHVKRGRIYDNLEASMHTDRHYPDKICITKVSPSSDERARALLDRRKEYWAKYYSKEDVQEENSEKSAGSKKAKQNKGQKKQEKKKEEGQKPLEISRKIRLNEHIKAMNVSVKCKRLEDILTNKSHEYKTPEGIEYRLPFQNICYRSDIRVVDFFPPNLEDFAVPEEPDNGKLVASDGEELDISSDSRSFIRWEWRFCLLVENSTPPGPGVPNERIRLYVSGPDAECLLGLDPVDLRRKKSSLRELRERLFILWGDLEERKSQAAAEGKTDPQSWGPVSSVPFTCCIKEYGVRCSHGDGEDADHSQLGCKFEGCFGWERRFGMFQTTIHS